MFSSNAGLAGGRSKTYCTLSFHVCCSPIVFWRLLDGATIACEYLAIPVIYISDLSPNIQMAKNSAASVKKSDPCFERAHYVLSFFSKNVTSMQNGSRGIS